MALEIERKFLVGSSAWRSHAETGVPYRQGYLASSERCTVRVRLAGARGFITLKGAAVGIVRPEYEYEIPATDADALLSLSSGPLVHKTRYRVPYKGHVWELDVFAGDNEGLVLAELELSHPDETFEPPPWLGPEVTSDPRYRNSRLALEPYRSWASADGEA